MRHKRSTRVAGLDCVTATACSTRPTRSIYCSVHIRRGHVCSTTCSIPHSLTTFVCTRYTLYQQIRQFDFLMRNDDQQFKRWAPDIALSGAQACTISSNTISRQPACTKLHQEHPETLTTVTRRATHVKTRFHNQHSRTTATHKKGRRQTQHAELDTIVGPGMRGLL